MAQYRDGGPGFGPGMMGWGWWGAGSWFRPIFMLFFWVLIVVLSVMLIKRLSASGPGGRQNYNHEESALDILKKRYARGEINKEEFEAKKKDLQ